MFGLLKRCFSNKNVGDYASVAPVDDGHGAGTDSSTMGE
jgi:hypothetical protein